jgi:hypothetical protein
MTSKRNIVTDRRSRPIDVHAYTLPVVREIPPDPPDAAGTQSLW